MSVVMSIGITDCLGGIRDRQDSPMSNNFGGWTDFFSIPVSQTALASSVTAEGVAPSMEFDFKTRTRSQRTTSEGTPVWEIRCLFHPVKGDTRHKVDIVPIRIAAPTEPHIKEREDIQLVDLRIRPWSMDNGKQGLTYMAAGFRQGS